MGRAYYNEYEPYAAQWLRNLIDAGLIPRGDVDERSIVDVAPSDLAGYTQCHFFAGIGGWALAARLAGWPDDRELWTGSAPCQPFSVAGSQRGTDDDRHLWPDLFRLIRARRPAVVMGEQVAAAVGANWLDGVFDDLESVDYACRAAVVPACAVDAPHRRDRLWFVAHSDIARACEERQQRSGQLGGAGSYPRACVSGAVPDTARFGERKPNDENTAVATGREAWPVSVQRSHWDGACWIIGHDGKARRVASNIRGVVDGLSESLGRLCAKYYAEAAEGVIAYATATKQRPREVLRAVRDHIASEAIWQKPGGFFGIRQAEVLLPFLRELEGRIDASRIQSAIEEAARESMRGLRIHTRSACSPQGRGLQEQRSGEYPDAMHALSQLLACTAGSAFEAICGDAEAIPLLGHGVPGRVGRLRAYGNAICVPLAAEIVAAYMDCRP